MKLASCYDKYFRRVGAELLKIARGTYDPLVGRRGEYGVFDCQGSVYSNLVSLVRATWGQSLGMGQSGLGLGMRGISSSPA